MPSKLFKLPSSSPYHYTPRIGVKSLDFECLQRQHLHLWDFSGVALETVGVTDTHKAPPVDTTVGRWALHCLELFHKDICFVKTVDYDQFSYGHPHQLSSMSHPINRSSFDLEKVRLPWGTDMILQLLPVSNTYAHKTSKFCLVLIWDAFAILTVCFN